MFLLLTLGFILKKLVVVIAVNLFNTGWYSIPLCNVILKLRPVSVVWRLALVTAPLAKPFRISHRFFLADSLVSKTAMWILIPGSICFYDYLPKAKQ